MPKEVKECLRQTALRHDLALDSIRFARQMDGDDPLRALRKDFHIPKIKDVVKPANGTIEGEEECIYLCGNSLGLQPILTEKLMREELEVWACRGVHGHFDHPLNRPWSTHDEKIAGKVAKIVGAELTEVAIMSTLTTNLHLALVSFYTPTDTRYKILCEDKAFPSDLYALKSQTKLHNLDPEDAIIRLKPRDGEYTLRTEDIINAIERESPSLSLVFFSGVQYYTGQFFDLPAITDAAHKHGIIVGFDLAHAVGNVPLKLHEWKVDFAVWCSYKYLNSGPGAIGGLFIHEDHAHEFNDRHRLEGWWGTKDRFKMSDDFDARPGAHAFQLSNPSIFATIPLFASLNVFQKTNMENLREKSLLLTSYLELLLKSALPKESYCLITPSNPNERGCQLSLLFAQNASSIFDEISKRGVVCDKREPDVIRVAPVPLYNTFEDVWRFVQILRNLISN